MTSFHQHYLRFTLQTSPPRALVQIMVYADDITITSTRTSAAKKYIQPYLHKDFAWTKQSHTSSSCRQTSVFHLSTHFFTVSLNLLRSSNEQGCARRVYCIMCAVFYVARPHSQVVSLSLFLATCESCT